MAKHSSLVHVTFSLELLQALDNYVTQEHTSRSEFIRQAVVEKIRSLHTRAPQTQPYYPRIDLLMTDAQLDDLRQALLIEHRRRHQRRYYQ